MDQFTCSGCNTTKPLTDFNRNRKRVNGHDNRCRECMKLAAAMRAVRRKGEFTNPSAVPVDRQCVIEGCQQRRKGHGYCPKHLQRFQTHGDPLAGGPERVRRSTVPSFRPKGLSVEESFRWFMPGPPPAEGVVWRWRGPQDDDGYGCFVHEGVRLHAHRVAYELFVGPIPEGHIIRHKNDTPIDVNPYNMLTGTRRDNRQDAVDRNRVRGPRGTEQWQSKLTEADVVAIRARYALVGVTQRQLAEEYGVYQSAISKIVNHERWSY